MDNAIDVEKIAESMSYVTLAHMAIPLDVNRIILENYQGAEKDLCVVLVQGFYTKFITEHGGKLSPTERSRALTFAKWQATRRLTTELKGLVDRSTMFLLMDAQRTGWHHDMEYDDVAELLASVTEGKEGSDEAYDWKFIIETLIPAAQQAEIPVDTIINASLKVKKMRGVVPAARELLERQKKNLIEPEEAKETLNDWLVKVADPNVSYTSFHEEVELWRGNSVHRNQPITSYKIMAPDGKFMLVIPTSSDKEMAVIEQALKNRAEFNLTGFDWLINRVLGMMKASRINDEHDQEMVKEMRKEMKGDEYEQD